MATLNAQPLWTFTIEIPVRRTLDSGVGTRRGGSYSKKNLTSATCYAAIAIGKCTTIFMQKLERPQWPNLGLTFVLLKFNADIVIVVMAPLR